MFRKTYSSNGFQIMGSEAKTSPKTPKFGLLDSTSTPYLTYVEETYLEVKIAFQELEKLFLFDG